MLSSARPSGTRHAAELHALYRRLGGLLATPTWRPGGWDLVFGGSLVVELDEELHFNRYRALTLNSSWAKGVGCANSIFPANKYLTSAVRIANPTGLRITN
jgi:hypothetical protein